MVPDIRRTRAPRSSRRDAGVRDAFSIPASPRTPITHPTHPMEYYSDIAERATMTDTLQHTECPRCHAPNLGSEVCCFACGARLKALPKRFGSAPPAETPWPMWIGLLLVLVAAGLIGFYCVTWLVGYREQAGLHPWYLPVGGMALVLAGQFAFREGRLRDARGWRYCRAPFYSPPPYQRPSPRPSPSFSSVSW